jgi:hypothetical protein
VARPVSRRPARLLPHRGLLVQGGATTHQRIIVAKQEF